MNGDRTVPGAALLIAAAPSGRGRLVDAASALPALAAVRPDVLTGTAAASVVELVEPADPQVVLTRLRVAASVPGQLLIHLIGQLTLDRKQQLPHVALARTTPATVRYTALPWHWLSAELQHRRPGTTTVLADLVADRAAWARLATTPGLGVAGAELYGAVAPPPERHEPAEPRYSRVVAELLRPLGHRPPAAELHAHAVARASLPAGTRLLAPATAAPLPAGGGAPAGPPLPPGFPTQGHPPPADRPTGARVAAAPSGTPETAGPGRTPTAGPAPVSAPTAAPAPASDSATGSAPASAATAGSAPAADAAPAAAPIAGPAPASTDGPAPAAGSVPAPVVAPAAGSAPAPAVPPAPVSPAPAPAAPAPGVAPCPPVAAGAPGSRPATPARPDRAPVIPAPVPAAAPQDPHPAILAAAHGGRHSEAAAMAAAWEQYAMRTHGPESAEAVHWLEVRADLARLAGGFVRSCELWMSAASARLGDGEPAEGPDVVAAVDRAHHCWEQVGDPVAARDLAVHLVALRRRVPGPRPGAVEAVERRLESLSAVRAS